MSAQILWRDKRSANVMAALSPISGIMPIAQSISPVMASGLRSRKTRVQDDNANIVLKGAEQTDERSLLTGLGLPRVSRRTISSVGLPCALRCTMCGPVLVEGLKQVIGTKAHLVMSSRESR